VELQWSETSVFAIFCSHCFFSKLEMMRQENSSDCGVFVLLASEEIVQATTIEDVKKRLKENFNSIVVKEKREEIFNLIQTLKNKSTKN